MSNWAQSINIIVKAKHSTEAVTKLVNVNATDWYKYVKKNAGLESRLKGTHMFKGREILFVFIKGTKISRAAFALVIEMKIIVLILYDKNKKTNLIEKI